MVLFILFFVIHLIAFFGVVVLAALAENSKMVDYKEFPIVIGAFVPLFVLTYLAALYLARCLSTRKDV